MLFNEKEFLKVFEPFPRLSIKSEIIKTISHKDVITSEMIEYNVFKYKKYGFSIYRDVIIIWDERYDKRAFTFIDNYKILNDNNILYAISKLKNKISLMVEREVEDNFDIPTQFVIEYGNNKKIKYTWKTGSIKIMSKKLLHGYLRCMNNFETTNPLNAKKRAPSIIKIR